MPHASHHTLTFTRYGRTAPRPELYTWLDRCFKPLLALAKKGGLEAREQLDALAPVVELFPEYAVDKVLLEMLTSEVRY